MSRYIDADKLIEDISNVRIEVVSGRATGKTIFTEAIKLYHNKILELVKECRLPNVLEVVRCKDCKHWIPDEIGRRYCELIDCWTGDTDFCSRGRREE